MPIMKFLGATHAHCFKLDVVCNGNIYILYIYICIYIYIIYTYMQLGMVIVKSIICTSVTRLRVLGSLPTFLSRPLALQTVSRSTRHSLSHILFLSLNIIIWKTSIWVPSVATSFGVVRLTVSPRLHGSKSVHHRCSISLPPPHRLKAIDASMRQSILLPTLACLILSVAYRALGFSSGAPEESCDSFTVNHTHVGSPAARLECDATCLSFRQLRLIGSSADSFTYNCNETYERELSIATEVTVWTQL